MERHERKVAASPEQVWRHLSDLEHWADMLPTVDEVTRLDDGPIGEGSRFRLRQPGLPAATYVVTHWQPNERFTWESRSPGVVGVADHRLTGTSDGTTLALSISWSGLLAPIIRRLFTGKAREYLPIEAETFAKLAEDESAA